MSLNTFPMVFTALAVVGLSLAALAVSQTSTPAHEPQPEDHVMASAPLCSLSTQAAGRGLILSAQVSPETTMTGTFSLAVTRQSGGNSAKIRQGGAFEAPGGETTLLSMSSFNSADGLEAALSLKVGGKTIDCDTGEDFPLAS